MKRSRSAAMTSARTAETAAALIATLGLAAASWVFAVRQMNGMDMGVTTRLGSPSSFVALWVLMMAAMMLPGGFRILVKRKVFLEGPTASLVIPASNIFHRTAVWGCPGGRAQLVVIAFQSDLPPTHRLMAGGG